METPTGSRFVWHDLVTSDPQGAWGFYAGLFGWTESGRIPRGPMGSYRTYAADGAAIGGIIMGESGPSTSPGWIHYIRTDAIEGAARRVRAGGGEVAGPILDVPGGRAVHYKDPEGAAFGLYQAAERSDP